MCQPWACCAGRTAGIWVWPSKMCAVCHCSPPLACTGAGSALTGLLADVLASPCLLRTLRGLTDPCKAWWLLRRAPAQQLHDSHVSGSSVAHLPQARDVLICNQAAGRSPGECVGVNFGRSPFIFDLDVRACLSRSLATFTLVQGRPLSMHVQCAGAVWPSSCRSLPGSLSKHKQPSKLTAESECSAVQTPG